MKKLKLIFLGFIISCSALLIFSCNNSGVSPTNYSRVQVVNTLAGSTPFYFLLNTQRKYTSTITFPAASGYVSVTPATYFVRFQLATTSTLLNTDTTIRANSYITLKLDSSYSVFITGSTSNYTLLTTLDDLSSPSAGKAKIRFINTSTNSGGVDVTINGTKAYTNIVYKGVGSFIEVPTGVYEFRANKTNSTSTLATLSDQTLANGKVYTVYAAGQVGSTASNAAFGLNLITNLLPATK